jgi:hypothetical protein
MSTGQSTYDRPETAIMNMRVASTHIYVASENKKQLSKGPLQRRYIPRGTYWCPQFEQTLHTAFCLFATYDTPFLVALLGSYGNYFYIASPHNYSKSPQLQHSTNEVLTISYVSFPPPFRYRGHSIVPPSVEQYQLEQSSQPFQHSICPVVSDRAQK